MDTKYHEDKDVIETLSYIKTVTSYKKDYGKQVSVYFMVWGFIWIASFLISGLQVPSLITVTWLVLGIGGWLLSGFIFVMQRKSEPMPKFLNDQLKLVWIGFISIIYIVVFLVISAILPFSLNHLFLYNILLISILYVLLGIVLTRKLFFMGIWLMVLGTATYSLLSDYIAIIFSIFGGGSLLLTGLYLRRNGIKHEQS